MNAQGLARIVWSVLLAVGLVGVTGPAWAAETPQPPSDGKDDPLQLVVVITGRLGGVDRLGAGIVVGEGGDRLYIATANHVVRQGGKPVQDLRVRFKALPGEALEAKLLDDFDDKLDLAVLSVADLKRRGIDVSALPFARLGDLNALTRGSEVYELGHPNGKRWRMNVAPDRFARKTGDWLHFESTFLASGHSGGALLNDRREIVGMLRGDQPPDGEALSIVRVVERLRDWGYTVSLGIKPAVEIAGRWVSQVMITPSDTRDTFRLSFDFDLKGDTLLGSISEVSTTNEYSINLGGILDGRVKGDTISFYIRRDEPVTSKDIYYGSVRGSEIEFTRQSDRPGSTPQKLVVKRSSTEALAPETPTFLISCTSSNGNVLRKELGRLNAYDDFHKLSYGIAICLETDVAKNTIGVSIQVIAGNANSRCRRAGCP